MPSKCLRQEGKSQSGNLKLRYFITMSWNRLKYENIKTSEVIMCGYGHLKALYTQFHGSIYTSYVSIDTQKLLSNHSRPLPNVAAFPSPSAPVSILLAGDVKPAVERLEMRLTPLLHLAGHTHLTHGWTGSTARAQVYTIHPNNGTAGQRGAVHSPKCGRTYSQEHKR